MNKEVILNLANLSRLRLSDEETENFSKQIESILDFVNQINEVKIEEDVVRDFSMKNIFRKDNDEVFESGQNRDDILKEMGKTQDGYLKVKKILNN